MQPDPTAPTTALVLETNNLQAAAPIPTPSTQPRALLDRLRAQTRPLSSLDEVVVTHAGLPPAAQAAARARGRAAG